MKRRVVEVHDASAPELAPYLGIRERDLKRTDGTFIVEGETVLRTLVRGGRFPLRSLFLCQTRLQKLHDVLERLPEEVNVYVAPQAVMDQVVGFPIHRGILGLGVRRPEPTPEGLVADCLASPSPRPPWVVGIIGVANHDNVGGIFRCAAAFGAKAVFLDDTSCDPLYRKAIRVSVGSTLLVPFTRCRSGASMVELFHSHGLAALALAPRGTTTLAKLPPLGPSALLLGSEEPGLPPEILAKATGVRIPMVPDFDSLNVAVAGGIAMHWIHSRSET